MKILIINGPNLNLLGYREPKIYGSTTMDDILDDLYQRYPLVDLEYYQSNSEGDIIDHLQDAGFGGNGFDGIVLNAGGYTHTSVAIADAVAAIPVPVIEVHISNVAAREEFRHHSMLAPVCQGSIVGLGTKVYRLAVSAFVD